MCLRFQLVGMNWHPHSEIHHPIQVDSNFSALPGEDPYVKPGDDIFMT